MKLITDTNPIYLPKGVTPNTECWQLPNVSGYKIEGVGRGVIGHSSLMGHASYLVREGGSDEEFIRIIGADQDLRDFTIYGEHPKATHPTGVVPKAGVLVTFGRGTGTGSCLFERMHVYGVGAAYQFGQAARESMCDSCEVRGPVTVGACDYVVNQVNDMAISNTIQGIEAIFIRKAFARINGGGNFAIKNSQLVKVADSDNPYLMHFGDAIGSNTWTYTIDNFKADLQCGPRLGLVKMDVSRSLGVTIIGVQIAHDGYGDGKYLYDLKDGGRIKIMGGSNILQKHSIFVAQDHPNQSPPEIMADLVDQCCEPKDMVAPGSAPVRLTLHGCYKNMGGGLQKRFNFYRVVEGAK